MSSAGSSIVASSLKRDTVIYGLATAVDRLSGFILLPLLTTSMDRATFGAWNQILAAWALGSNILELGFYHSIVRYVPGADAFRVGRVLHGMLALIAFNCTLFILLALLVPNLISQVLFAQKESETIILAAAFFIVSECFFEFLVLAFLRADGRILLCSIYYIIKNIARVLLLWGGLAHGAGIGGLLNLLTISNAALVVIVYLIHIAPRVPLAIKGLEAGFWPGAIRYSGSIVLSANLSWANVSLNRFLIVYLLGLAELGVYSANYSIASIVNIGALIVNFTVVPRLNQAWNRGDKSGVRQLLSLVTSYYCFATIPAAVAIAVFYTPLMQILISREYAATPELVFLLVTFMVLLGYEQLTTYATYLDNAHFSVRIRALSLAVNVSLSLVLLKAMGIAGGALAGVASAIVVIWFNCWFIRRMAGYQIPLRSVANIAFAAAAMGIVGYFMLSLRPAPTFGYTVVAAFVSMLVFVGLESMWSGSVARQILAGLLVTARRRWN